MTVIKIITIFFLSFAGFAQETNSNDDSRTLSEFLKPSNIREYVVGEIATLNINFGFDIFDETPVPGLDVSTTYDYEMEPSYIPNKYMRTDSWTMKTKINPGALLDVESPVHFSINNKAIIHFIRNFDRQIDALKAMPYNIKHLPRSAKSIRKNLKPGDFVSFPAQLTIGGAISEEQSQGIFEAKGVLGYYLSGKFTVNVFKQDERFVRLKLVANSSRGTSGSASGEFADFAGTTIIEDIVEKIVFTDIFKVLGEKKKGESYIIDYLFDLDNEQASQALDNILKPQFRLNLKDLLVKYTGIEYLEGKLLSDFSLAEKLHSQNNGVVRVFKGFNRFKYKRGEIEGSLLVAKASAGSVYYKNNISIFDENGEKKKYFFPNKISYYKGKWHFKGLYKREDQLETSFYGLVPLDAKSRANKYSDVGMSFWRRDDSLTSKEWKYLKQKILNMWPLEIVEKLDFSVYDTAKRKRKVQLDSQILFKENAFDVLKNVSVEDIQTKFKEILENRIIVRKTKLGALTTAIFRRTVGSIAGAASVSSISKKLHRYLTDPNLSARRRVESIIDLQEKSLFKKYGFRLLMELVPREKWEETFFTKFRIAGIELPEVKFELGELKHSKIFEEILSINKELHDPSRDLRFILSDYSTDFVTLR